LFVSLGCPLDAIFATFEVEQTTAIYSGLLRMSGLASMQPNIKIDLFMVAWDSAGRRSPHEILGSLSPARSRPCPRILPPPHLLPSCGGGMEQIGSANLLREFPEMKGFSPRNLKYMRKFAKVNQNEIIVQEMLAQITWYHHITILESERA